MVKTNNKKPKTGKKTSTKKSARPAARSSMVPAMSAYLRLLADPCGASLARAPYAGTDGGYLVRTRLNIPARAGTAVGTTNNYILQWTPAGAAQNGFIERAAGQTVNTNTIQSDFINSGVVSKARPLASCLKWVPTGPVTSRQGAVGLFYSTGQTFVVGATAAGYTDCLALCNSVASNGSVPHEVRWLPTAADEFYTNPLVNVASENSGGTVGIVLLGVDAVAGVPNGYFEATTIYEWIPAVANGAAPAVAPSLPFTVNDVTSKIHDMGNFLFGDASVAVGSAVQKTMGHMVTTMLTGATYMAGRRGNFLSL